MCVLFTDGKWWKSDAACCLRLARQWFLLRLALRSQHWCWLDSEIPWWLEEYRERWFGQNTHQWNSTAWWPSHFWVRDQETGSKNKNILYFYNNTVVQLEYLESIGSSETSSCLRNPAPMELQRHSPKAVPLANRVVCLEDKKATRWCIND